MCTDTYPLNGSCQFDLVYLNRAFILSHEIEHYPNMPQKDPGLIVIWPRYYTVAFSMYEWTLLAYTSYICTLYRPLHHNDDGWCIIQHAVDRARSHTVIYTRYCVVVSG